MKLGKHLREGKWEWLENKTEFNSMKTNLILAKQKENYNISYEAAIKKISNFTDQR